MAGRYREPHRQEKARLNPVGGRQKAGGSGAQYAGKAVVVDWVWQKKGKAPEAGDAEGSACHAWEQNSTE